MVNKEDVYANLNFPFSSQIIIGHPFQLPTVPAIYTAWKAGSMAD
jgi:hypothetical protein